jgi:HEAT repeat protein
VDRQAKELLPVLLEALSDEFVKSAADVGAQKRVMVVLGEMGPQARAAVPVLLRKARDMEPSWRRQWAIRALKRIDPEVAVKAGLLEGYIDW